MAEKTPTLSLSAGSIGEEQRASRFRELAARIQASPAVVKAREVWEQATEAHTRLTRRHGELNQAIEGAGRAVASARESFIAAACEAEVPTSAAKVSAARALHSELLQALEQLVTDRTPTAHIASLLAEAEFQERTADALDVEAAARLKALAEQLAPAIAAEGQVVVDPRATVSGALAEKAAGLRVQADGLRQQAAEVAAGIEARREAAMNRFGR